MPYQLWLGHPMQLLGQLSGLLGWSGHQVVVARLLSSSVAYNGIAIDQGPAREQGFKQKRCDNCCGLRPHDL
ncbi:hypothetical protein WJX74_002454 [Apatococcus lobatus]|uniref:Uncharacterized protein n=1 Tax=Apatococcus lobatus TaxID=904363 RepID=A0AAW1SAZ3_9CHLO